MKLPLSRFSSFLFKFVVLFVFFDGIRSNVMFNTYFSQLKEGAVLLLFLVVLKNNGWKVSTVFLSIPLFFFYFYHSLTGIMSLFDIISNNPRGITVFYKYYQFLLLGYSFFYYTEVTRSSYRLLFRFIVIVSIVFVFVNSILYFTQAPILINPRPWWGRFSVGYPTMDVVSLCYSLVAVLFMDLGYSNLRRFFFTICLILGILLQVTGTGFFLLSIILLAALVYFTIMNRSKRVIVLRRNIQYSLLVTTLLGGILIGFLKSNFGELFDRAIELAYSKMELLIKGESTNDNWNTLEFRANQEEHAKKYQTSMKSMMFGIGFGRVNLNINDLEERPDLIHVENQYALNEVTYGFFGSFLFFAMLIYLSGRVLLNRQLTQRDKVVFLLFLGVFLANSKTLISLFLFSNMAFFALIYAYYTKVTDDVQLVINE